MSNVAEVNRLMREQAFADTTYFEGMLTWIHDQGSCLCWPMVKAEGYRLIREGLQLKELLTGEAEFLRLTMRVELGKWRQ